MARLRRSSPQAYCPSTDDDSDSRLTTTLQYSSSKLRSSPRKVAAATYFDDEDTEDTDVTSNHLILKPKTPTKHLESAKKIRLKSLSSLAAQKPLGDAVLPEKESPKRRKGPRLSTYTWRTFADETTLEQRLAAQPKDKINFRDLRSEGKGSGESDSSEDSSDGSEDDLPDAWKLLSRSHSTGRRVKSGSIDASSVSNGVEKLTVTTYNPYIVLPIRLDSESHPAGGSEGDGHRAPLEVSAPQPHFTRPCTPPQSPSKPRLQSPSKTKPKVPSPALRQSLDAFWSADTINDWNDHYSPQKALRSPKKLELLRQDETSSPSVSPRKMRSPSKRNKVEMEARKDFAARKHQIAESFLQDLDLIITDGQISQLAAVTGGVRFIWSKTLNSTAGRANWRRETIKTRQPDGTISQVQKHHASIELAEKVIDDENRLLNVIAHEFCHLCNFMISGIKDQPHGAQFKAWGRKCTTAFGHRGVEVTTKHSYEIDYRYVWQCSNEDCGAQFRRHSKSIDPQKHTCGSCRGTLVQIKPMPRKATGAAAKGYSAFVKEHFATVKKDMPGASQKEIMEGLGRKYRAEKTSMAVSSSGPSEDSMVKTSPVGSCSSAEVDDVARVLEFVTLDD